MKPDIYSPIKLLGVLCLFFVAACSWIFLMSCYVLAVVIGFFFATLHSIGSTLLEDFIGC